jgi:hypothetical protein
MNKQIKNKVAMLDKPTHNQLNRNIMQVGSNRALKLGERINIEINTLQDLLKALLLNALQL